MTKHERQVKKYIDAWCEGKRVQVWFYMENKWIDVSDIDFLLSHLRLEIKLRIVKGKRG